MTLRFAVAGLWHETNTFSNVPADFAAFESDCLVRGPALWDEYAGSNATIGGFLSAGEEMGVQLVPVLHARTGPIGTITEDAFERITADVLAGLRANGPWDGVLLANHGAAVSARFPDADAEFIRRVRSAVGAVPIAVALDLHANVSPAMVSHCDLLNTYQTNPHLDASVRGAEILRLLVRQARREIRPIQALATPPLVINITKQHTAEPPMTEILARAQALGNDPDVLSISAIQGYPYADVAEMGMSFHVITDGVPGKARALAKDLAAFAFERRESMLSDIPSAADTLRQANQMADGATRPVVIMDVGDNILGGSSADSTVLLRTARELGVQGVLQTLYDPDAVEQCIEAGTGATVELIVGAKTDAHHGTPLPVHGTIERIGKGQYQDQGATHGGFQFFDDGLRALFRTDDGATLLLTSNRSSNLTREQWYSIGIRPEAARIVVAKGVVSPRPAYEPIAHAILLADTPGLTTANLNSLPYSQRRRPLYPFEPDTPFSA